MRLVDYLKTDSDTRKYLKAAFPEYEDSMIESLQQDQETSCRLLALIINQNLHHFDREKLEFVAEYVERITQRPTFWDDANTWIQFSPVLTLQYLLDELDSLELGVCFTKYNYALEYLSAAITGRSCPEKVFDIRENEHVQLIIINQWGANLNSIIEGIMSIYMLTSELLKDPDGEPIENLSH